MRLPKKAQSTLETSILIAVVITTAIIMFPYIRQSWNAHLKSYEEEIELSQYEKFAQAPSNAVTLPGCSCDSWQNDGCGDGSHCSIFQTQFKRRCEGRGCPAQYEWRCDYSGECCDPAGWKLICNDASCCGVNASCEDGYGKAHLECGGPDGTGGFGRYYKLECRPFDVCQFSCGKDPALFGLPQIQKDPPLNSQLCAEDEKKLTNHTFYNLSDRCSDPAGSDPKCQSICNENYRFGLLPGKTEYECLGCETEIQNLYWFCGICTGNKAICSASGPCCDIMPDCDSLFNTCSKTGNMCKIFRSNPEHWCPPGTEVIGGFCQFGNSRWQDTAQKDHGSGPMFRNNNTESGWECSMEKCRSESGDNNCEFAAGHNFTYCVPEQGCPRPVLVDLQIKNDLSCPGGYTPMYPEKNEGADSLGGNISWSDDQARRNRYCEKLSYVAPSPLCAQNPAQDVIGISHVIAPTVQLGDTNTPGFFACPNIPPKYSWKTGAWDGYHYWKFCHYNEGLASGHCLASSVNCPVEKQRTVVTDIYGEWNNNNPPLCKSGYVDAGIDSESNIRFCLKKETICIK